MVLCYGDKARSDRLRQRMSSRFAPVRAYDQYIAAIFLKQKQTIYVLLSLRIVGLSLLYGLSGFSPYAGY